MHDLARKVHAPSIKQCEEYEYRGWEQDAAPHLQAFVTGNKPPFRRRLTEEQKRRRQEKMLEGMRAIAAMMRRR
jgi:hypothetical protein